MKKKLKKPAFELTKKPIEQVRKEFISTWNYIEKFFIYTCIMQYKILDGNYYKTDKDYSCWFRLNPLHPFSYLIIVFMVLEGILKNQLDYDEFWHNLKGVFKWNEEEL